MKKKLERYGTYGTIVFKSLFLILTLLSFCSFTAHRTWMSYFSVIVTIVGACVLLFRLTQFKSYYKTKYLVFLFIFTASYILTMFLNYKYGILESVKGLVWLSFQFFILYACDTNKSPDDYKKEFKLLAHIVIVYFLISIIISLFMFAMGYSKSYTVNGELVLSGFLWGRLWGTFSEPNIASIGVCITAFLSLYFLQNTQVLWKKIFYIATIILPIIYISLSDSRTGLVCLVIGVVFYTYLRFIGPARRKKGKIIFKQQVISILLALVVGIGSFGLVTGAREGYNLIASSIQTGPSDDPNSNQIGREQDLAEDISNRRFDIWKSGFELFQTSPVYGVGFRNITAAAEERIPDTYIVNNDQGSFASLHNLWVDTLASQGLIGLLTLALFAIFIVYTLFRYIFWETDPAYYSYAITLFSSVTVCVVAALFVSDILYVNTANAFLFWTFLGYLAHLVKRRNLEKDLQK